MLSWCIWSYRTLFLNELDGGTLSWCKFQETQFHISAWQERTDSSYQQTRRIRSQSVAVSYRFRRLPFSMQSLSAEKYSALHTGDLLLINSVDIGKDSVFSMRLTQGQLISQESVMSIVHTTCLGMSTSFFSVNTPSFKGQAISIWGRLSQRSASCLIRVIKPYLTWRKTVAPGSMSFAKVPFAEIVSFSPL